MVKLSSNFVCQQCGYTSPSFLGRCPHCDSWNSLVETAVPPKSRGSKVPSPIQMAAPVRLSQVATTAGKRISTGIGELDRVLGGGFVLGMTVLLSGEPGIGKSTLLLQINRAKKTTPHRSSSAILYIAGEESPQQIKIRAERLGIDGEEMDVLAQTDVDLINEVLDRQEASLVIVDSIQTLATSDLTGPAGSIGQVRECAARLATSCKSRGTPLVLVGHVTKDGSVAGPKTLEHIVDTVLSLDGDHLSNLRLLTVTKNRFGPTDEVGVFTMTDSGLIAVPDPDKLLVQSLKPNPGSCLTIALEGTRPMLVEIQALVTGTTLSVARRVSSGIDYNRLQTIVAILQKRLRLPLFQQDVYVSVTGGLRLFDPAADLPVALAILSSFRDKPLLEKTLATGELDLLGNIRPVKNLEKRIKEAKVRGFSRVLSSLTLKSLSEFHL